MNKRTTQELIDKILRSADSQGHPQDAHRIVSTMCAILDAFQIEDNILKDALMVAPTSRLLHRSGGAGQRTSERALAVFAGDERLELLQGVLRNTRQTFLEGLSQIWHTEREEKDTNSG